MELLTGTSFGANGYQEIFFDRPVSSLRKRNICILVGSNTSIFEVQQAYQVIQAMNHNPVLIADDRLRNIGLPADLYLSTKNKMHYENTDEAIELIEGCYGIVAGLGIELNSSMQLFLEKVLTSYQGLVLLTESTFRFPGLEKLLRHNILLAGSTKKLLSLSSNQNRVSNSGLLRKIELLSSISLKYHSGIICQETNQILAIEVENARTGVMNSTDKIDYSAYLSILVSLLSDRNEPLDGGWSKYALAAGYLYINYFQKEKNPQLLKEFLQSQF